MESFREPILSVLSRYPDIKLCTLFGSAAAGKTTARSDLDIAVAAHQPLSVERYLELLADLSSATGREIDLVDLTVVTGQILKEALSTGIVLQNLDKEYYAQLIIRMLFNQADMMPYHDRILRERRERFLNE